MIIKYDKDEFDKETIEQEFNQLINQIYKLLPMREEGKEWKRTALNLINEVRGLNKILVDQFVLFNLLCKMEGLVELDKEDDFLQYRSIIFECLNILTKLKNEWIK